MYISIRIRTYLYLDVHIHSCQTCMGQSRSTCIHMYTCPSKLLVSSLYLYTHRHTHTNTHTHTYRHICSNIHHCIHIQIYTCIHVYVYMDACVYLYMYTVMYIWMHVYIIKLYMYTVYMDSCVYLCMYTVMHMSICMCMYVYVCLCVCVCHMYLHTIHACAHAYFLRAGVSLLYHVYSC